MLSLEEAEDRYKTLGITGEIEKAVIDYLEALGALATCYVHGSSSCTGGCPSGQHCITSTTGNCLCVND